MLFISVEETQGACEATAEVAERNGWQVGYFEGDQASKTKLWEREAPKIIYIATHGFFVSEFELSEGQRAQLLLGYEPLLRLLWLAQTT